MYRGLDKHTFPWLYFCFDLVVFCLFSVFLPLFLQFVSPFRLCVLMMCGLLLALPAAVVNRIWGFVLSHAILQHYFVVGIHLYRCSFSFFLSLSRSLWFHRGAQEQLCIQHPHGWQIGMIFYILKMKD